jgi:Fe2+ or Zn2+ uptake regulation protein
MKTCSHELAEDVLLALGSKNTPNRRAILEVLFHAQKPLSAKEIKKNTKNIDQVTIYRVIKAFVDAGIVRQVFLGTDEAFFEFVDEQHDHHHLVCTSCNKVSDFVGCQAEDLIRQALKQTKDFAQVTSHSFELFGLCRACNEKRSPLKKSRK